jgi:hypothetical protein
MRKAAAIILSVTALVLFSGDAQARRLSLSFVRSVPKSVAPISKPVAAPSAPAGRSSTLIMVNTNRPMAAAPRTPASEGAPLHESSDGGGHFAAASEKPVEQKPAETAVVVAEHQPEAPVTQTTPLFVTKASPPKPAERAFASVQPARTVYCAVQSKGGCAPF